MGLLIGALANDDGAAAFCLLGDGDCPLAVFIFFFSVFSRESPAKATFVCSCHCASVAAFSFSIASFSFSKIALFCSSSFFLHLSSHSATCRSFFSHSFFTSFVRAVSLASRSAASFCFAAHTLSASAFVFDDGVFLPLEDLEDFHSVIACTMNELKQTIASFPEWIPFSNIFISPG